MNSTRISTHLTFLIGVMLTLLVAVGGLGLHGNGKSSDALKAVYETTRCEQRNWARSGLCN
jgi:hypothetical protein